MRTHTDIDREEVAGALREAAYHLAACWDALRELEMLTGEEVETDNLIVQSLAADCEVPATYPTLDDQYITDFLESLEEA